MKKLFYLLITILLLCACPFFFGGTTSAQTYEWAFNVPEIGGNNSGLGIATDPAGNGDVYVTGIFRDTADFDPSGNTANLIANGAYDAFVAKYDIDGNYMWAFNLGGTSNNDSGNGITTDVSGNVYVTGIFWGTADFDPSGNTANLTSNGNADIFVATYDANGNYLWAFNVGGGNYDVGNDIAIDTAGSGDVYITGYFTGAADFDPSGNTANLTSNGNHDVFVAKYDATGSYLWAFNVGGIFDDYGRGIYTDPAGSGAVYVCGRFQNTADFDPSGNTASLTSNGGTDFFVAKYDSTGNYLWAFNVGGTSSDYGLAITTDVSGNVYVTGNFRDTADFDPSGNTANLISNGQWDIFVAKYDSTGNYLWAFNVGRIWGDSGSDIAIDPAGSGDVYVTGYFTGTADFDPSGNTANLTSNGSADIFVARYDATGNYQWAFNVGGTDYDVGYGIATDPHRKWGCLHNR